MGNRQAKRDTAARKAAAQSEQKRKQQQEPAKRPMDPEQGQQGSGEALGVRRWSVLEKGDEDGRQVQDDYKLGKKLGEGSYGKVREGVHRVTGQRVAIKSVLKKNMRRLHTLRREIAIMKNIDHPNIIKMFDVYEDSGFLYIVMEMCSGGELFDRIIKAGFYTESDAVDLVRQILEAVAYLHSRQIAHRDLKPENFLFQSEEPNSPLKLIDFGLSRFYKDVVWMKTRVGTPYYIAPEVLSKQYDKACDIWSVGVIMYILLCGYPPFYGDSERQIYTMIRKGAYDFPPSEWSTVSPQAKDLINLMLDVNPRTRVDADAALRHAWFANMRGSQRTLLSSLPIPVANPGDGSTSPDQAGLRPSSPRPADTVAAAAATGSEQQQQNAAEGSTSSRAANPGPISATATSPQPTAQPTVQPNEQPTAQPCAAPAAAPTDDRAQHDSFASLDAVPSDTEWHNVVDHSTHVLANQASAADSSAEQSGEGATDADDTAQFDRDLGTGLLGKAVIQRLRKFAMCNKLKRAALGVIVRYLNREEINSLRDEFALLDTDGNGMITVNELAQAMRRAGLAPSASEVERLVSVLDEDDNGKIDYAEFLAASIDRQGYMRDELLETAFHYFDTDGSGSISAEDLLARLGSEDASIADSILAVCDIDKNGTIDFEEFKAMMRTSEH